MLKILCEKCQKRDIDNKRIQKDNQCIGEYEFNIKNAGRRAKLRIVEK